MKDALLTVDHLKVAFGGGEDAVTAVNDVSFSVDEGEVVALVGESGSGKSVTSLAIMGLLAKNGRVAGGQIRFQGRDIAGLSRQELTRLRGRDIAMIFQEPMTSLDPLYSVGEQIAEVLLLEKGMRRPQARARGVELLHMVGITDPERRYDSYPHELSGGMRQRVMIAIAIAREPKLIIADEPTTALDVTIQKQILSLLLRLRDQFGMALLLITHDLAVVSQYAQRVVVMYAGRLMEVGDVAQVISDPRHAYTQGLLRSIPQFSSRKDEPLYVIPGSIPSARHYPAGCSFSTRCGHATPRCAGEVPPFVTLADGRIISCWRYADNHSKV